LGAKAKGPVKPKPVPIKIRKLDKLETTSPSQGASN
jgi:hypothetical protein